MLIKVDCGCYIKEEIQNCIDLIRKLGLICGTTMQVNGITIEIQPHDIYRGAETIHEEYIEALEDRSHQIEDGEVS